MSESSPNGKSAKRNLLQEKKLVSITPGLSVHILNMTFITGAAYFTLIQLHTFTLGKLASMLLHGIGIPGHVPHIEWVSVLFIQGTSQNSEQPLSMYCNALNTDT